MKNSFFIFGIVLMMLFLVGCVYEEGTDKGVTADGVHLIFEPGFPPEIVDEDDVVNVRVRAENNAEVDVNGRLCVRSLSASTGGFADKICNDFELNAASETDKPYEIMSFESEGGFNVIDRDYVDVQLSAQATYKCDFTVGTSFCVKRILGEGDEECERREVLTGSSLYSKTAPITLMKVVKEISPRSDGVMLNVELTLRKAGGTEQYVVNSIDDPEQSLKNNVRVQVSYGSHGELLCKEVKNNMIEWKRNENQKIIKCEKLLSGVEQMEKDQLDVKLGYYYRINELTKIRVENADEEIGGGY